MIDNPFSYGKTVDGPFFYGPFTILESYTIYGSPWKNRR